MKRPISLIKLVLYGCLTWLIPFVVSVPLMGRDGQPVLPMGVFKSLMIVVGAAGGGWLLVRVFRQRPLFRFAGVIVGMLWFGINVGLDLLVLVPLTKMRLPDYFAEIALRYLVIVIMAIAIERAANFSSAEA